MVQLIPRNLCRHDSRSEVLRERCPHVSEQLLEPSGVRVGVIQPVRLMRRAQSAGAGAWLPRKTPRVGSEKLGAELRLCLGRRIAPLRLGWVLPFLLLFVRQRFLLFRVFLQQLLRLVLMLLLD